MKLTRKNTTMLQILGIILVVIITSVLMFKPELVPGLTGETRSVSGLIKKKEEIEKLNLELESTDGNLSSIKNELGGIESELVSTEIETERLRKGIEDTNFEYHLPSIMVMLEQKAKELNLEFYLDYDRIQTLTGGESGEDFIEEDLDEGNYDDVNGDENDYPEDDYDDEYQDEIDEFEEPQGGEDEEFNNPESGSEANELGEGGRPKVDMSELTKDLPNIPGINITSIPIEVMGSYGNIRLFIEYLDEIDLLEHNIVDLFSFGKEVSAVIAFNVYHTSDVNNGNNDEIDDYNEFDELDEFEHEIDYEDEYSDEEQSGGDDY